MLAPEEEQLLASASCPACDSTDGALGTSYAYYICHNAACAAHFGREGSTSHEVYYLGDGQHPSRQGKTRADAVAASPYGQYGTGAALLCDGTTHLFRSTSRTCACGNVTKHGDPAYAGYLTSSLDSPRDVYVPLSVRPIFSSNKEAKLEAYKALADELCARMNIDSVRAFRNFLEDETDAPTAVRFIELLLELKVRYDGLKK